MKRWIWLLVLPLIAAANEAATDPESLLRQGDEAFLSDQPAKAATMYDRASLRTREPARAAFNLATSRYRQARDGTLTTLPEAEVNYRACLENDEYRARALYGLANCLLMRAESGSTLDRAMLKGAIDRYNQCLGDPGCDEELARDARYNRSRARLLLLQAPPPKNAEQPQGDEPKTNDRDDQQPKKQDKDKGDLVPAKDKSKDKGKAVEGPDKNGTDQPGAGAGLPPVQDDPEAVPLAKEDAERHLELAAKRILEESMHHRRSKGRPTGAGGKDW
jgi:hypothetical protein